MKSDLDTLDNLLSLLQQFKDTGRIVDDHAVRNHIESTLQIPLADSTDSQLLIHPFILTEYANLIVQHAGFDTLDEDRARRVRELIWPRYDEEVHVRLRRFRPQDGFYYGLPFRDAAAVYTFWSEEPVLVTCIERKWREELFLESEMGWLSRPEVKTLAALTFSVASVSGPTCYFQFSDEVYDIPASIIATGKFALDELGLERLHNVVNILRRMKLADIWGFKKVFGEASPFAYRTRDIKPELTRRFYENFDINDELALRIAFLLLKAATLWRQAGFIFGEEATTNLFFALEGCLHLLHRRMTGKARFEVEPTLSHVEKLFPEKPGYRDMLEDAYEKRVQLVHPITNDGAAWLPHLMADDFYENYGMAVDILFYAITGDKLPTED